MGKLEQAYRLMQLHGIPSRHEHVLVVEYPKSGGTWLGQIVSAISGLPFPRNQMPDAVNSVYHGHYKASENLCKFPHVFWLVRDPRDVMVSLYYHWIVGNDKTKKFEPGNVPYHRANLGFDDINDVKINLPAFIEYAFTHKPSRLKHFTHMGSWTEFNSGWLAMEDKYPNVVHRVHYENMLADTAKEAHRFSRLLGKNHTLAQCAEIVEPFSFKAQTGRTRGQTDSTSFLRKGVAGGWKDDFSPEAIQVLERYAGACMRTLGYE